MICVPDSSPLIILSKLEQTNLLVKLYDSVVITPQVWNEVIEKGKVIGARDVIYLENQIKGTAFTKIKLTAKEKEIVRTLKEKGNGLGETEVLAVSSERQALAILDDKNARALAIVLGIQQIGTVGVLYESYRNGLTDYNSLEELLEKLSRIAWISPELLANIMRRARKEQ
jgi:predicted nucleic acid-binding protein